MLKALDDRLGLSRAMAECLRDPRQQAKIRHDYQELLRQRLFAIACGYADCNDAARLVHDPVHKLLAGRDPLEGLTLASQATLSRFENAIGNGELLRVADALADTVIAQHKRRRRQVRRITIDLDPTLEGPPGSRVCNVRTCH